MTPPTDIPTPRHDKLLYEESCNFDVAWSEEFQKLERENVKLTEVNECLQNQLEQTTWPDAKFKNHLLANQISQLKEDRDELKAENSKAKEQIEDLLVNLQIEKEKNSEAEEFVLVKSKHLELLRENGQLNKQLSDSKAEVISARRALDVAEAEIAQIKTKPM